MSAHDEMPKRMAMVSSTSGPVGPWARGRARGPVDGPVPEVPKDDDSIAVMRIRMRMRILIL